MAVPWPIPPDATLADLGEFGLIADAGRPCSGRASTCSSGPGDDAAVLRVRTATSWSRPT